MLGPVNRLRIAVRVRGVGPRRDCRNGQRHRQTHPEDPFDSIWLKCHDSTPGCAAVTLRGNREDMCELRHASLVVQKIDVRPMSPLGA
jgi:hypothetical protein